MQKRSVITETKIDLLREGVFFKPIDLFTTYPNVNHFKTKRIKVKPTIVKNAVYDLACEKNILPSEILLTSGNRQSICKLRYNEKSSIEIRLEEDCFQLYKNNQKIDITVSLVPHYEILEKKVDECINGINSTIGDYIDVVGIDRLSILFFEGCYNWNCGKACKFCDLHPKQKTEQIIKPTVNNLRKYHNDINAWWNISKESYLKGIKYSITQLLDHQSFPHKHLFFMAGNLPTAKDVWNVAEDTLQSMSSYLDLNEFDSYLNIAPHDTLERLKRIKRLGIKQVQYNLEIANKELFEDTCPGKMKYDLFVGKLIEAVSVFGFGNVRSNFVFGLQDKEQMLEEIKRLADKGIVADYSIFQPKNNTPFQHRPSPDFEDVLDFSNRLVNIYLKYHFKPIFCSLSSRSSIINELYEDRCSTDFSK